jgi:hypothetical protein
MTPAAEDTEADEPDKTSVAVTVPLAPDEEADEPAST